MSVDPQVLRSASFADIGAVISRNVDLLIDRWQQRAIIEQPEVAVAHRQELHDQLPSFLTAMGKALSEAGEHEQIRPCLLAAEHGEQRWRAGWRLSEVIRDYQILRLVILERLELELNRAPDVRESMAVGLILDEGITAAVVSYIAYQEQHVRNAEDALDSANRAKSEFLANMSHEIRTPMTAILGFTDILRDSLDHPEHLEAVHTIKRNGEYLLEIINDILDLSKIEAGKLEVECVSCSAIHIAREVAALMEVPARAKGLTLDVVHDDGVPDTFLSDPLRLRQVLINLVGNAVKFTERGSIKLVVRLNSTAVPPRLEFAVEDTGIGMTPEQMGRVFEPFTQTDDSAERRRQGTGLGLTISKRLTEILGGSIDVSSEVGRGSTFRLRLPFRKGERRQAVHTPGPMTNLAAGRLNSGTVETQQPPEKTNSGLSEIVSAPVTLAGCRVLVADDRRDNRYLISRILEKAGATVDTAENGRQALKRIAEAQSAAQPYHVVLMDMLMPELNGFEAVAKLRAAGWSTPVVALTASAMAGDRDRCLQAGCDDYLTKPIDSLTLITLVHRFHSEQSS